MGKFMITPRHNEHWPQGHVTVFTASDNSLGVFFGTFQQLREALKNGKLKDAQYACFNSSDFPEVETIFIEQALGWGHDNH